MDLSQLTKLSDTAWRIEPSGQMRVPAVIYGTEELLRDMDEKVREQSMNVAMLPGIIDACYVMPDAHWGYGFPIGGVAAFDADAGGIISAGGVGFDISCGVRTLHTALLRSDIEPLQKQLADALYREIPAGVGSTGQITLHDTEMTRMLAGGARWAVDSGYGEEADLDRIEECGEMSGARPEFISDRARKRQRREMGTLGSGNHYLEVQEVDRVYDAKTAEVFGIDEGDILVTIHCGSRGLGHQLGTEFLRDMAIAAERYGIHLPDRELACAPIKSDLGERYLGAMRAAINCAFANRQILTHLTRQVFAHLLPKALLRMFYDVSHNTCKVESHEVQGEKRNIYVHRKGATRAFGPGHPDLPDAFKDVGQPVLIGGSMGTESHILAGNTEGEKLSWSSACHGAGRRMSRRQANRTWRGRQVIDELASRGILIRSPSLRGIAEEAPGAYKAVEEVVEATEVAGLARRVARLKPLVCVKG